ncbi:hypothetical protein [Salipiger thiooxidans]|uniref:hypothetical protein n=1 Tax=Salipiger thiooxidans TaxID=282683 RepID=UPI001CD4AA72|nr:hypothetical protein [Salipiger thiooxidans]MCA0851000.1 hypothetical protein [Salipiger thiooxidans]
MGGLPPLVREPALKVPESTISFVAMINSDKPSTVRPSVLPSVLAAVRALSARLAGRRARPRSTARPAPRPVPADEELPEACRDGRHPRQIDIPFRDSPPDSAERGRLRTQGRFLARQDDWETLARGLREADIERAATFGGTPVARLLAEGAHSDAVESALAAVGRNDPTAARASLFALRDAIDHVERDPWLALVPALAHLAVARGWAGRPGAPEPGALRRDARAQHLEAAQRLVARFDPLECDSPALAAVRCALLDLEPRPEARVIDDYEDLIDLDPACPEHMRALGRDLRPSRFGNWDRLDHEARRTAGRTADLWGSGGYAWVWFDALASGEAGAFAAVDGELFAEALHDILARRPDQHMANQLAAFCGLSLPGAAAPRSAQARIAGCFGWIVHNHLREIHPDLWARARPIPGSADAGERLRRGKSRALSALAEHFAHQLRLGRQVRFSEAGIALTPTPCSSCTLAPCSALAYPRRDQRDEDTPCLT